MTPLLILLDGVVSQDERQVRSAIQEVSSVDWSRAKQDDLVSAVVWRNDQVALECIIRHMLKSNPNIASMKSARDRSLPLHFAAVLGHGDIFKMILKEYPAAVLAANEKGKLPIHYAAREGKLAIVEMLLESNPGCAKFMSKKQKLPLHFSVCEGHRLISLRLLHAYPEAASIKTQKGRLPLHFASRWGHIEVVKDLISAYPEAVKCFDWEGSLPLHDAAREGQFEVMKYLLTAYKEGVFKINQRGETPIFSAARSSSLACLELLLFVWPEGGKKLLVNLGPDDGVGNWDWIIIDLCLRSAVGMLPQPINDITSLDTVRTSLIHRYRYNENNSTFSCELAEGISTANCCYTSTGYKRPLICCTDDNADVHMQSDEKEHKTSMSYAEINFESVNKALCSCAWDKLKRPSKLQAGGENLESAFYSFANSKTKQKMFLPLHAAFECKASYFVVYRVLTTFPDQARVEDHLNRTPLHLALQYFSRSPFISKIVHQLLVLNHRAAFVRDYFGRLPLHNAILQQAETHVIKQLFLANESSAFELCGTHDSFKDKDPLFMAVSSECDLEVIYLFIRGRPSIIKENAELFNMIQFLAES